MRISSSMSLAACLSLFACTPQGRPGTVVPTGNGDTAGDGGAGGSIDPTKPNNNSTDPVTCDQAASQRSYIGCDYWPTVVANGVDPIFDYAVVVANNGAVDADIQVTGPGGVQRTASVAPNELTKIYLPWVLDLKGGNISAFDFVPMTATVRKAGGAYHLVSTAPVTVYQFNALEYKGQGGPSGKDWSQCQDTTGLGMGCYSYTNDASLLLPSTAMTGNYRVAGIHAWQQLSGYVAITGTQNGTTVTFKVSQSGEILAGGGLAATKAGGTVSFNVDQGEVVEILGGTADTSDLSGSVIQATAPIQVITGHPCMNNPADAPACDHVEETVFPAETLGKHYIVTVPTGPNGTPVGHTVRFYGNVDGTNLTYHPTIAGAPDTLNAGEVVEISQLSTDFEVTGDHEFIIGSFQLGGTLVDPMGALSLNFSQGDPAESFAVSAEQFRSSYVFLAPDDYSESYVDIAVPAGATVTVDGTTASKAASPISGSTFGVLRLKLGAGVSGAHVLTATAPVGIQVMGYGDYTSYQYPGGLDLQAIAPPPIF